MGAQHTSHSHLWPSGPASLTRTRYYQQLDQSTKGPAAELGLVQYALEGFVDQLGERVRRIRELQWSMAWRDHVYRSFDTTKGAAATRRSRVVLALSPRTEPVAIDEIPGLSPSLADDYARRSRKTLPRDLHELICMGLVTDEGGRYRAARERILAFLPWRKESG